MRHGRQTGRPTRGDPFETASAQAWSMMAFRVALGRIAAEGLTPDSIPAQGQRVVLRNNANLSTGGTATDASGRVYTFGPGRFRFPFDPTAPADRDDVRLTAELQAIAQDETRTPARPEPTQSGRSKRSR